MANVGSSFIGAIFWFILASFIGVEKYGSVQYDLAIPYILATVGAFGLNITVAALAAKGISGITKQAVFIVFVVELAMAVVLLPINWIYSLVLLGAGFFTMSTSIILGYRKYKEYALMNIGSRIVQLILSLLLYNVMGASGVILGFAISNLIFSYRFFSEIRIKWQVDLLKKNFNFTGYNFASEITHAAYGLSDKLVIGSLFGYAPLGFYQLGLQFMNGLGILPSSLSAYILPEESKGIQKKAVKICGVGVSVILAAISFYLVPYVVNLWFKDFTEATSAIQVIIIGVVPMTFISILNSSLLAKQKGKQVLIGTIAFVSTQLPLLIIMGNSLGLIGFATAVLASQSIQAFTLWLLSGRKIF